MDGSPAIGISAIEKGMMEVGEEAIPAKVDKRRTSSGGNSIFDERELQHPTTDLDTLMHLVKGCLGSGILAMPLAFKNAGLHFGLAATFFIGITCTHCVHMLVETAHGLCRKLRIPSMSYGEVAKYSFENGPRPMRAFGTIAGRIVDSFLVVVTLGASSVYLVFVSSNLQQVVDVWTGSEFPTRGYIACFVVPMLILCSVRNLRLLSPLSILSNALVLASLGIILYYVLRDIPPISSVPNFSSAAQLPEFFSTAVFALEGIGVIMPIENNMKNPHHFTGCCRVLNTGMAVVITMFAAVGYFGYLKFGDSTKGSISLNVPDNEALGQASKLMLTLAMTLTYPLQMYVAVDMTWGGLQRRMGWEGAEWRGPIQPEHLYRYVLVLFTAVVALSVPALDALMSLIGAVCLSSAGIIFPAIIETVFRFENLGRFKWVLVKNIFIVLFGALGFGTGMVTSIQSVIKSFSNN